MPLSESTAALQGVQYDFKRLFLTCLFISIAEFSIIHLTNILFFTPLLLLPFVAGWQMALPLAFFKSVTGKAALDTSYRSLRRGRMMMTTALALVSVSPSRMRHIVIALRLRNVNLARGGNHNDRLLMACMRTRLHRICVSLLDFVDCLGTVHPHTPPLDCQG